MRSALIHILFTLLYALQDFRVLAQDASLHGVLPDARREPLNQALYKRQEVPLPKVDNPSPEEPKLIEPDPIVNPHFESPSTEDPQGHPSPYDDDSAFVLTSSWDGSSQQTLFTSMYRTKHLRIGSAAYRDADFDGPEEAFFSKIFDVLAYKDPKYYATVDLNEHQEPLRTGRPTGEPLTFTGTVTESTATATITFNPAKATDVCGAFGTLRSYCGADSAGTECACYSSTYYVPEQWNSLAAGCAQIEPDGCSLEDDSKALCPLVSSASASLSFCPETNSAGATGVRFAATFNINATVARVTPSVPAVTGNSDQVASAVSPGKNGLSRFFLVMVLSVMCFSAVA